MADGKRDLQRVYVLFTIPQFFDDTNAMRVRENAKEFRKFLGYQSTMRHGFAQ